MNTTLSTTPEIALPQNHQESIEMAGSPTTEECKEVGAAQEETVEFADQPSDLAVNLVYSNEEEEPEIHIRTWIAYGSMVLLLCVQSISLNGPPAVLSFIGADLGATGVQTWIPNSLALAQACLGPVIASASDTFQSRKLILLVSCVLAFIGSTIAPGSQNIYRVIAAQSLIGVGFAAIPITYSVPSEILPKKWRPMAQAVMTSFSALMAIMGPLVVGYMTKQNAHTGWRKFYWIQCSMWAAVALGIFFGYQPPKRHTRLDHLSVWEKLHYVDLPGFGLLTTGATLLLVGLNLGGNPYRWTDARVLSTIIIGLFILVGFGVWEWKGTRNGIVSHELFQSGKEHGRTFSLCLALISIEAIMLFSFIVFYPVMTITLFEADPFLSVARIQPYWVAFLISCPLWGYVSTKSRSIKESLFVGYLLFTAGIVGLATIQPGDNFNQLAFAALAGFGFGSPLILIIAGIQLATPHHLIATATAVPVTCRGITSTIFTAIYAATFTNGLTAKIPSYLSTVAIKSGLAPQSIPQFIGGLTTHNTTLLDSIPNITPTIIEQGSAALQHAYADSLRLIYIIAAPFGVLACVLCFFLCDLKSLMSYRVDAPVEALHAKHHDH